MIRHKNKSAVPRAPRGSDHAQKLFYAPEALLEKAQRAADREGVNFSEWVRQAIQEKLDRR